MRAATGRLVAGDRPSAEDLAGAFGAVMDGEATPAQIAALLTALRIRGETAADIVAAAGAMRARMRRIDLGLDLVDVCGTGGDGAHTLNISTAVALVLAGAGVRVAKHGNRAASSKSGGADVLEALGVRLDADDAAQARAIDTARIAFLFAQAHHAALRHAAPVRREIGFRTIFNLLGPLSNPAGARRQLVGVFDAAWLEPIGTALRDLGAVRAWVVHGAGGLDEVSLAGPTQVCALEDGALRRFILTPADAGLPEAPVEALRGGDAAENAAALRALLAGATGPYRDAVVLNAAAAFAAIGEARDVREGADRADAALRSGAAAAALAALVKATTA
ncbi:MAG: anthranilate phosphoribosyltransferase [Alphaproteobacteria bacterium]|nr:anthranilate phosphoribosyltransferase [Alphaproteobacteria bacterium]